MKSFDLRVNDDFMTEFAAVLDEQLAGAPDRPGSLFLTGGSQAHAVYPHLAGMLGSPSRAGTRLYLGDERVVAIGHPDSNTSLVSGLTQGDPANGGLEIATPAKYFTPALTDPSPGLSSQAVPDLTAVQRRLLSDVLDNYGALIEPSPRPRIVHLGLGPDGHIASIFPQLTDLGLSRNTCQVSWDLSGLNHHLRISLTMSFINDSEAVVLGFAGTQKGALLRRILESPSSYPAGLLEPQKLVILVDRDAAGAIGEQN